VSLCALSSVELILADVRGMKSAIDEVKEKESKRVRKWYVRKTGLVQFA